MKSLLSCFLIALAAPLMAAPATPVRADLPGYTGFDDCRIAPLEPAPHRGAVDWNGPCKDGFATAKGELDWKDDKSRRHQLKATLVRGEVQGEGELKNDEFTYIGTLRRGIPHGAGFYTYKNKTMYEGDIVDGKRQGKGIMIRLDGSEYTGEWKDNEEHGFGEIKYGLGGSYAGPWHQGKEHGRGKIVYAGSGRSAELEFDNGRPLDGRLKWIPHAERVSEKDENGKFKDPVQLDHSWEQLPESQRLARRTIYPALEPGDDPPYPTKGLRMAMDAVSKFNVKAGVAEGTLTIYVLVGADGKARQARIAEKPALRDDIDYDQLAERIAGVMLLDTYKPAMCRGQACEMVYPLSIEFTIAPQDLSFRPRR